LCQSPKARLSDNSIGAIAYLTPGPAFFFLAIRRYNKRPYVRFHSWQSIVFNAFVFLFWLAMKLFLPFAKFLGPVSCWAFGVFSFWSFFSYGCGA